MQIFSLHKIALHFELMKFWLSLQLFKKIHIFSNCNLFVPLPGALWPPLPFFCRIVFILLPILPCKSFLWRTQSWAAFSERQWFAKLGTSTHLSSALQGVSCSESEISKIMESAGTFFLFVCFNPYLPSFLDPDLSVIIVNFFSK